MITCELLEGVSKEDKEKKQPNYATIVKAESIKWICSHKSSFLSWLCIFTLKLMMKSCIFLTLD